MKYNASMPMHSKDRRCDSCALSNLWIAFSPSYKSDYQSGGGAPTDYFSNYDCPSNKWNSTISETKTVKKNRFFY